MPPLSYATADDLAASVWAITPVPAGIDAWLRLASGLVRDATITAFYTTDDVGTPTDERIAEGFADAVMAQCSAWAAMGVDPQRGAVQAKGPVSAKSIASASFTYAGADEAAAAQSGAATVLCRESARIIWELRLFNRPIVFG